MSLWLPRARTMEMENQSNIRFLQGVGILRAPSSMQNWKVTPFDTQRGTGKSLKSTIFTIQCNDHALKLSSALRTMSPHLEVRTLTLRTQTAGTITNECWVV